MIFHIEPMVFPTGKVGGEFVREVLFTSLLTQLDAGAPYNRKFFRGRLGFDTDEEAEKIQWGTIPRKASQKWMKIEMWQMEFGLR
jgi:hypothetical protein